MRIHIVDSSVAAKWFSHEEFSDAALRVLRADDQLHAPDFFLLEMDNIVCKWIRRGLITAAEGTEIRAALRRVPITIHPVAGIHDAAFAIANDTGRALYDCLYVALAVLLDGQMVTADRRLYDALAAGTYGAHLVWVEDVP